MAVRPIRIFPDPALSQPSATVTHFDDSLRRLVRDLTDTMMASPGVGLAAPQIGVLKRVSVIDTSRFSKKQPSHGLLVLINPEIIKAEGNQIPREGCLSVPDFLANVARRKSVVVRTLDLNGAEHEYAVHDFEALAFQHEIDHLNGKLFLDRVSNVKTDVFRRKTYK